MNFFIKKIFFPILFIICSIIIISSNSPADSDTVKPHSEYVIKSYKNTVALYNGEEIVQIYHNIVLNTLPEKDVQNFNKGVRVSTPTQAEIYLEDFE